MSGLRTTDAATHGSGAPPTAPNPTVLSVVIPAYNEEDGIAAIVKRVLAVRPALAEVGVDDLELIVVDDGSDDRTAAVVAGYPAVRLVRHPTNRGYGAALKTGFGAGSGGLLAFLDADGRFRPSPSRTYVARHWPAPTSSSVPVGPVRIARCPRSGVWATSCGRTSSRSWATTESSIQPAACVFFAGMCSSGSTLCPMG